MTLSRPNNGQVIDAIYVDQFYDLNNGGQLYDVAGIYGGPGLANDSTNINSALNAASTVGGGRVFLRPGTWNIGTTLGRGVTSDNVELVGAGQSTILRANTNLNDDMINFQQPTGSNRCGVRLANFYLDGNGSNQSGTTHGIHLQGTYKARVDRIRSRFVKGIGLWLHQVSGQPAGSYNYISDSLFTDGIGAGSVGLKSENNGMATIVGCSLDTHSANNGKGLWLLDNDNVVLGGTCDANAYNAWIEGGGTKFHGTKFDRAYFKEVLLNQSTCLSTHFMGCEFGYFVGSTTLNGGITGGATVTSLTVAAIPCDIPGTGVPIMVDYGAGSAETFTVTAAGALAGATTIPVTSRVATSSHSVGALVVPRWRGVDQQNSAGPTYFTDCQWGTLEALPQAISWPFNLGEDSGSSSISTSCEFRSPGGLTIPNQLQAASQVRHSAGVSNAGVSSITVTGSPFTYTNNDNVPEAVYIDSGTVTTVAKNSTTCFSFGGAAAHCTIWLEPTESVTVTYSPTAPTMRKDLK